MAYSRTTIIYLSINFKQFEYCRNYIRNDVNIELYNKINKITKDVNYLKYITNKNKNILIPQIQYDEEELNQKIFKNIDQDKLKFKYKWQKFDTSQHMHLLQYLVKQNDSWVLNESTLEDIFNYFHGCYRRETLRKKCFHFGYEYNFN